MEKPQDIDLSEYAQGEVYVEPNIQQIKPPIRSNPHILILLHGIRTEAQWMNDIIDDGVSSGRFKAIPVYYGNVSTRKFLKGNLEFAVYQKVLRDIKEIFQKNPSHNISIMCHSFGTKVFCDISEFIGHEFYLVFLVAGVVKNSDAAPVSERCVKLINDCSERDIWPWMATKLNSKCYEASGTYGFRQFWAVDRYFPYKHSTYLKHDHFKTYIVPAIVSSSLFYIKHKDARSSQSIFNNSIFILTLIMLALCLILYLMVSGWI